MNIADTAAAFAAGILGVLAFGVFIWGLVQLRQNGATILSIGAILASAGLVFIAFLIGQSGTGSMF